MNDEAIQIASPEERDLVARLIRMGVIAPMILDGITRDQVEEITAALPTVYECRYTVFDQEHQEHVILCSDLTPEAVNRQFFSGNVRENHEFFSLSKFGNIVFSGSLDCIFKSGF
ncbi:MAG: hypothetical protein L6W00_14370 [Lentisphaeria bacterium]|nr:MAG: hypothetical protein L6W00_14370 [Lentisphaeria bacterium]